MGTQLRARPRDNLFEPATPGPHVTIAERALLNAHRRMLTRCTAALAAYKANPTASTMAALLWETRCRNLVASKRREMVRR